MSKPDIWEAAVKQDLNKLRQCIDKRHDIDCRGGDYHTTPLIEASTKGWINIVKILLENGSDIHAGDDNYYTALHCSADNDREEITEVLLERGAMIDSATKLGWTPLMLAARHDRINVMKILVKNGANVAARDLDGETAIMKAAGRNHTESVKFLIESGASYNDEDRFGSTTAELANNQGHNDVVELLIAKGATKPTRVLPRKDITNQQWRNSEKKNLLQTCHGRILVMGPYMAGKTSLVHSIVTDNKYTCDKEDRTVIADMRLWTPDKKSTFLIVDDGGHDSYMYSAHYFHCNSSDNLATLCHDIKSKDYNKSFEWIKAVVTRSPECSTMIALTQADTLQENDQKLSADAFIEAYNTLLDAEVHILDLSISTATKQNLKTELFEKIKNKYLAIKEQIATKLVIVSSKDGNGIDKVKEMINRTLPAQNEMALPAYYQEFYLQIGQLGSRILSPSEASASIDIDTNTHIKDEPENKEGVERKIDRLQAPHETNKAEEITKSKNLMYLKKSDVLECFKRIAQKHNIDEELEEKMTKCLKYFHKKGFLMYYPDDSKLKDIVFHDIASFITALKAIFHHDVKSFLQFDTLSAAMKVDFFENNEVEFEKSVKWLSCKGLLSLTLLEVILNKLSCDIDPEVVMALLVKLEIGFTYKPKKNDEEFIFIPWYIRNSDHETKARKKEFCRNIPKEQCIFNVEMSGKIPRSFWNHLLVCMIKNWHEDTNVSTQEMNLWNRGFEASFGKNLVKILMMYDEKERVTFFIKGEMSKVGHDLIWSCIKDLNGEAKRLMSEWWPGLLSRIIIICNHCLMKMIALMSDETASSTFDFHLFNLDNMLRDVDPHQETVRCEYTAEDLPSAMCMPLSKDNETSSKQLKRLCEYIKERANQQRNTESGNLVTERARLEASGDKVDKRLEAIEGKVDQIEQQLREDKRPLEKESITHKALYENYDKIIDYVQPAMVLQHLFSTGIVSIDEKQVIDREIENNQIRRIAYAVSEAGDDGVKEFISVLKLGKDGEIQIAALLESQINDDGDKILCYYNVM